MGWEIAAGVPIHDGIGRLGGSPVQDGKRGAPACRERPSCKNGKLNVRDLREQKRDGCVELRDTMDRGCKRAPELDACVRGNANMWRVE